MADRRESAAADFVAAVAAGYAIYSTLNSSPWTAESFGGDPEKARSCLYYSKLATITNIVIGVFATVVFGTFWPLAGFAVVSLEMHYLYRRAVAKAQRSGSRTFAHTAVASDSSLGANATQLRPRPTSARAQPSRAPQRDRIATPLGR